MAKPLRIDAAQARQKTHAGEALLVCAYQDEEKCRWLRLEGAMTLDEFRSRLERLAPEQEVIFYCT